MRIKHSRPVADWGLLLLSCLLFGCCSDGSKSIPAPASKHVLPGKTITVEGHASASVRDLIRDTATLTYGLLETAFDRRRANKRSCIRIHVVRPGAVASVGAIGPVGRLGGRYDRSTGVLQITYDVSPANLKRVLIHELFHFYCDDASIEIPAWMEEGMADSLSGLVDAWGRVRPHTLGVNPWRLEAAKGVENWLTIRELQEFSWGGERAPRVYAQAWAVMYYVLTAPTAGRIRDGLLEGIRRTGDFSEVLAEMNAPAFLSAARRYVGSLEPVRWSQSLCSLRMGRRRPTLKGADPSCWEGTPWGARRVIRSIECLQMPNVLL